MTESPFDARELVGLLADDDRRRCRAVLGQHHRSVQTDTGLSVRPAARAVQRLVDAGLVVRGDDGTPTCGGVRLPRHRTPPDRRTHDEPENVRCCVPVRDGRLTSIPTVRAKRLVVLDWLAQRFDPGRRYPEATVNLIISAVHPDTAALRRYLVDEGILDREHGEYWRTGGTFDPE